MPLITIECPSCGHTIQRDIKYPRKSLRYFCPECKKMVTVIFHYPEIAYPFQDTLPVQTGNNPPPDKVPMKVIIPDQPPLLPDRDLK